jgi:hypothetical protein
MADVPEIIVRTTEVLAEIVGSPMLVISSVAAIASRLVHVTSSGGGCRLAG